jgi:hypothetical protein
MPGSTAAGVAATPAMTLAAYSRHSAPSDAVDALEGERRGVREVSRRGLGERRERFRTEPIRQVLMKADAVGIDRRAARPVRQPAVGPVERLERALPRRLFDNRAEIAGMHPAGAGDRALLVGGEAFDLPGRQEQVRKRDRRPPEDRSHGARPAFGSIEVHDVRELVGQHQPQPVFDVEIGARRPHRVDDDRVVGQRGRVAVGEVRLIGEHHVGAARRRHRQRLLERAPRLFGDDRQPLRQRVLPLVKVDDEVLGRQAAEAERRIERARGGRPRQRGEQHGDRARLQTH